MREALENLLSQIGLLLMAEPDIRTRQYLAEAGNLIHKALLNLPDTYTIEVDE